MNKNVRKLDPLASCLVPICKNTVLNSPNKHFFHVPRSTRVQWCAAVNKPKVPKSGTVYICEDHLNLEHDLLNYREWMENEATRPKLKSEVPTNLKNVDSVDHLVPSIAPRDDGETITQDKGIQCIPNCCNKSVQVVPTTTNQSVNTITSKKTRLTFSTTSTVEETPDDLYPSAVGSTTEFSANECSSDTVQLQKKYLAGRSFILDLIEKKPFAYIGIQKQYFWIVEYLSKEFKMPSLNIIIVLYKIKNNETFARMKDLFEISLGTLWRIFFKTLKALHNFFDQLIYWPTADVIKRNLPPVFRTNKEYASIQTIIDCFEIEIEKPKKPIDQALTWSQYKNCNTIKYLIGATPDRLINFISEGYGGRITDMYLVEQSGFLECVPPQATILSDRGFKHLESHLIQKNAKVLRPPSVLKDTKMTKSEVISSKVLASLRIHIERLIRRVRLFKILKPHAVVNNKLINVLDDVVVVACGLINLQTPIIKT